MKHKERECASARSYRAGLAIGRPHTHTDIAQHSTLHKPPAVAAQCGSVSHATHAPDIHSGQFDARRGVEQLPSHCPRHPRPRHGRDMLHAHTHAIHACACLWLPDVSPMRVVYKFCGSTPNPRHRSHGTFWLWPCAPPPEPPPPPPGADLSMYPRSGKRSAHICINRGMCVVSARK